MCDPIKHKPGRRRGGPRTSRKAWQWWVACSLQTKIKVLLMWQRHAANLGWPAAQQAFLPHTHTRHGKCMIEQRPSLRTRSWHVRDQLGACVGAGRERQAGRQGSSNRKLASAGTIISIISIISGQGAPAGRKFWPILRPRDTRQCGVLSVE